MNRQESCTLVTNDRATDDQPRWARIQKLEPGNPEPQVMMEGTVEDLHSRLVDDGWTPAWSELRPIGKTLSIRPYVRGRRQAQKGALNQLDEVQYETCSLSFGFRTRAGSSKNPRAWLYSTNARVGRGLRGRCRPPRPGSCRRSTAWGSPEKRPMPSLTRRWSPPPSDGPVATRSCGGYTSA